MGKNGHRCNTLDTKGHGHKLIPMKLLPVLQRTLMKLDGTSTFKVISRDQHLLDLHHLLQLLLNGHNNRIQGHQIPTNSAPQATVLKKRTKPPLLICSLLSKSFFKRHHQMVSSPPLTPTTEYLERTPTLSMLCTLAKAKILTMRIMCQPEDRSNKGRSNTSKAQKSILRTESKTWVM
jgi:hypothetical protein